MDWDRDNVEADGRRWPDSPQYLRLGFFIAVCLLGMYLARSAAFGRGALWWVLTVAVIAGGAAPGWLAGRRFGKERKSAMRSQFLGALPVLAALSFVVFGHRLNSMQVIWFCGAFLAAIPSAAILSLALRPRDDH